MVLCTKLRQAYFFCFVSLSLWAQPPPHTFGNSGTLFVPAGITEMTVQAWGGGGAGGGASGATLLSLTGRGGAGGGGGAYATAKIVVVPGATLSVIVARQVAGTTTGVGATGETSTITGFENIIKAVGGSGGGANTTGTVPNGGAGGLASASSGTTTVNGGPGLIGATALLSLGLSSGAGGKGGIPGGGDGGASVPGTLENKSGNVGIAPGGGGSGAVQSLAEAAQLGGAGAAGQVIVSYTCPTYGISSVTAESVCASSGSSKITLRGSATSLPVGVYNVTYNLTNPVQNDLPVTMTVTTPGEGDFTLTGFTTVGTRNITITKLTSGACFANITSTNVASIITSAITSGGTVGGGTAVCNGSTSGTLSLTGNNGSVLSWESSVSPFTTWIPITNTATTYVSGPLPETTKFRAVVQNGTCTVARSIETTVVVNPLPQGSLTGNGPFCAGGSPQLLFTATAGTGPYTVIYKENGGPDRTITNISSGAAFAAFTTPVNNSVAYALVSVTDANSCKRTTGFTAPSTTITVNTQSSTPIVGTVIQPNCLIATGSVRLNGLLSSAWTIIQTGTVNNIYYGTGTSFTVPNLIPGNYVFTIQDATGCPSAATPNVEIKPSVVNTWNGTVWSKGSLPSNDTDIVQFTADYQMSGDIKGCSCIVNSGVNVVVNSGQTLTIANSLNNNGTLTFENNASLLQTNEAVNTGNIIYKRYTAPVRRYDFTFWSSPIKKTSSFKLHNLSPDTLGDKYYKYDPVIGWIVIYKGDEAMEEGRGYIIRAPQNYDIDEPSVFNGRFTGIPNNGTISIPLTTPEKSYLLGNPYPSAIYADKFISDNAANLYGTLYFWTHNSPPSDEVGGNSKYNYTLNDYAIYNLTGSTTVGDMVGDGATTPGYQEPPHGYIAAGQSFFVTSKTAQNAVFTNSMRVPGNNTQFFKNTAANKENETGHRVWLNLTNKEGAFKQILIGYVEGATNSWDNNYDGLTMDGNKYLDFYSINEFMKLVIQGRGLPFLETDVVPLGYRSIIVGEFTISIDHANGDLSSQDIYLEDKLAQKLHNLQTGDYNFMTEIGTFDERFVLHYVDTFLGVIDVENQTETIVVSVKEKIIRVTSTKENISEVSVFDVTGKLLYNKTRVNATELQIPNLQSGSQVLLVKTILENGNTTVKKVVF